MFEDFKAWAKFSCMFLKHETTCLMIIVCLATILFVYSTLPSCRRIDLDQTNRVEGVQKEIDLIISNQLQAITLRELPISKED
jgi:hypothetical protein